MSIIIKNNRGQLLDVAWGNTPAEYDLRGADLRGANLSGANLRWANLSGASLHGANLHYLGNCLRGYQYFLCFEDEPIIRAGCRRFTMPEARAHWGAAHEDSPILRAEILGKLDAADRIIAACASAR